jgi:hypothetical protein
MRTNRSRRLRALAIVDEVLPGFRAARASFRTAAGKRHSAAADHLVQAGAAVPTEDDARDLSSNATADGRYKAKLSRTFAHLQAASNAIRARAATRVPRMRTLESPDEVPNPYALALEARAACPADSGGFTTRDLAPDMSPGYHPYGQPPDGHLLALALGRVNQEDAAEQTPSARPETRMIRDANGTPDPYAAGLAKMRSVR